MTGDDLIAYVAAVFGDGWHWLHAEGKCDEVIDACFERASDIGGES